MPTSTYAAEQTVDRPSASYFYASKPNRHEPNAASSPELERKLCDGARRADT